MNNNTDNRGTSQSAADSCALYIAGEHLLELAGIDRPIRIRELLGDDLGSLVVEWHRQVIGHGQYPTDYVNGGTTPDPYVSDLLAIPVRLIQELLDNEGIEVITRAQVVAWAEAGRKYGNTDPELELWRAREIADPDLLASAPTEHELYICGVPKSVYDILSPADQAKVLDGRVIAPPKSPVAVARWLARHHFTRRQRIPGRRNRAWMRTLIRIDQTWYHYASSSTGEPPRWIARTDPEWMAAVLQSILSEMWYVKGHTVKGQTIYDDLKWWNPDLQTLKAVEAALAGLLTAGSGTHARELPDHYERWYGIYGGTSVLCRNGVLDMNTGTVAPNTPLWFSLTRIEADYDHQLNPDAVGSKWGQVLAAQWPEDPDAVTCLQQWAGYVLSGRNDLQRFMFIVGPKGSAKSLIAEALEALAGIGAELGIGALNSHFGLQQVYESGANFATMADMRFGSRDSSLAVSRLLAITGGDTVSIDRKNKAPVSAKLAVRLHGSANEIPRLNDHSGALISRMLILETSTVFRGTAQDDPGLKAHIIANELGVILRWAVQGLARLNAAGGTFTVSKRSAELLTEAAGEFSNVRQFIDQCCTLGDATDYVDLKALYRVFGKWAGEVKSGERMSMNAFIKALKSMALDPIRVGQKRTPEGQTGKWVVVYGIKNASIDYTRSDRFGTEFRETISTDDYDEGGTGIGFRNRRAG